MFATNYNEDERKKREAKIQRRREGMEEEIKKKKERGREGSKRREKGKEGQCGIRWASH